MANFSLKLVARSAEFFLPKLTVSSWLKPRFSTMATHGSSSVKEIPGHPRNLRVPLTAAPLWESRGQCSFIHSADIELQLQALGQKWWDPKSNNMRFLPSSCSSSTQGRAQRCLPKVQNGNKHRDMSPFLLIRKYPVVVRWGSLLDSNTVHPSLTYSSEKKYGTA